MTSVIFCFRHSAIATILFFLLTTGFASAQNGVSSYKLISSEANFWSKFNVETRLYTDDPAIAPVNDLADLATYLDATPHNWFVILLSHTDGDAFVGKMRADVVRKPAFRQLTNDSIRDANVVVIARLSSWTKAHPHYAIRVYTGPWMEKHDLGADSSAFYDSILPDMKTVSNANGPAAGARAGIAEFTALAERRVAPFTPSLGSSYPGLNADSFRSPADFQGGSGASPIPFWMIGLLIIAILAIACWRAYRGTTWTGPRTYPYNWLLRRDPFYDQDEMNAAFMDPVAYQRMAMQQAAMDQSIANHIAINQAMMNQAAQNQATQSSGDAIPSMPNQPPTPAPAVPEASPSRSNFDTRGGGTWGGGHS